LTGVLKKPPKCDIILLLKGGDGMAEEKKKPTSGRKSDQKMKPYLVYDYLMRQSEDFADPLFVILFFASIRGFFFCFAETRKIA